MTPSSLRTGFKLMRGLTLMIIATGLLASAVAHAAQLRWEYVDGMGSRRYFIDADSVKDRNGRLTAWVIVDYGTPQPGDLVPNRPYMSAAYLYVFDCSTEKFGTVTHIFYSGAQGTGEKIDAPPPTDASRTALNNAVPNSIDARLLRIVCARDVPNKANTSRQSSSIAQSQVSAIPSDQSRNVPDWTQQLPTAPGSRPDTEYVQSPATGRWYELPKMPGPWVPPAPEAPRPPTLTQQFFPALMYVMGIALLIGLYMSYQKLVDTTDVRKGLRTSGLCGFIVGPFILDWPNVKLLYLAFQNLPRGPGFFLAVLMRLLVEGIAAGILLYALVLLRYAMVQVYRRRRLDRSRAGQSTERAAPLTTKIILARIVLAALLLLGIGLLIGWLYIPAMMLFGGVIHGNPFAFLVGLGLLWYVLWRLGLAGFVRRLLLGTKP